MTKLIPLDRDDGLQSALEATNIRFNHISKIFMFHRIFDSGVPSTLNDYGYLLYKIKNFGRHFHHDVTSYNPNFFKTVKNVDNKTGKTYIKKMSEYAVIMSRELFDYLMEDDNPDSDIADITVVEGIPKDSIYIIHMCFKEDIDVMKMRLDLSEDKSIVWDVRDEWRNISSPPAIRIDVIWKQEDTKS